MRYRKLSPTGDYMFGQQQSDFYIDVPDAPAQAVKTRLSLQLGAWYLDVLDGTDWQGSILSATNFNTASTRDALLRARILGTPGVSSISNFNSTYDPNARAYSVGVELNTDYGAYSGFQEQFITVPSTPAPQPPAEPIDVTVSPTSATSAEVSWLPYSPASSTDQITPLVGSIVLLQAGSLVPPLSTSQAAPVVMGAGFLTSEDQ